jgi:hypothetical protein
MAKSMIRVISELLFAGVLIGTASQAIAGQPVTIQFSGSGQGTNGVPETFTGFFIYDQSQGGTAVMGGFSFPFQSSGLTHIVSYTITGSSKVTYAAGAPFTITTSGSVFQLQAVDAGPTTVTILLPTSVPLPAGPTLPFCESNTGVPYFPTPAIVGSSLTVMNSAGVTTFTGAITSISCSPATHSLALPASQAPTSTFPSPQAPTSFYAYSAPVPGPVYACQPRPTCCLSGLLGRRRCP